jgi:hypothetical protein
MSSLPSFYSPEELMDEDWRAEVEAFEAARPVFLNSKGNVLPQFFPDYLGKEMYFAWDTKPGDATRLALLEKWSRHLDIAEERLRKSGCPDWRMVYVLKLAGTTVSWVELWRAELEASARGNNTIRSDSAVTVIDGHDIAAVRRFWPALVATDDDAAEWIECVNAKQLPGAAADSLFSTAFLSKVSRFCEERRPARHWVVIDGKEEAWTHAQIRDQCENEGVACHPHFAKK